MHEHEAASKQKNKNMFLNSTKIQDHVDVIPLILNVVWKYLVKVKFQN